MEFKLDFYIYKILCIIWPYVKHFDHYSQMYSNNDVLLLIFVNLNVYGFELPIYYL